MKKVALLITMAATIAVGARAGAAERFGWVDVFIDSGAAPLAAYQIEIAAECGEVKIVGIEGGEPAAFNEPPYYDPEAIGREKVILGAFSTSKDLPKGRTRVARIHVMAAGRAAPQFVCKLTVAATLGGGRIPAKLTLSPQGETK